MIQPSKWVSIGEAVLILQFQLIDDNGRRDGHVDPETRSFTGNDDADILMGESQSGNR